MIGSSQKAVVHSHDGTDAHDHNQASSAVIEECQAGQYVWVRFDCAPDSGVQSDRHVIFSGFLIH